MPFRTLRELDSSEGTVKLVDTDTHHRHLAKSNIVLIPQPSADPNDPLNWLSWRKHMAFLSVCLFSAFNNFSGTVLSDSFLTIAENLGVSLNHATGLISWVILTLGLANFFWVPTAIYFGKRPVFILSCAITFIAALWAAGSTSFGSLQAACVVGAFGGGASEALSAAIINDIYFLHERGSKMGLYVIAIAFGSSLGPLCGGYIIQNKGWPWAKWISGILLGFDLLMIIFFAPETRFDRSPDLSEGLHSDGSQDEMRGPGQGYDPSEKGNLESQVENNKPDLRLRRTNSSIPVKTYFQSLTPWSGTHKHASFLALMFRPIPLLLYPACILASLTYSISLAPTVMINILSSVVLIPPPYNFSVGAVGLINIPGLIGQGLGAIIGGICIDKWAEYRARRNGGVFKPETRLTVILIPSAIVFIGVVLFGFACERQMSWPVIFVAYGFVSVGLTSIPSIGMTYVCDSYFPVAAESLEMVNGIKNVVAFGFVKAAIPWVQDQGYEKTFGALAGIFIAFVPVLALSLIIWGPKIRHYTSSHWRLISWELEK